jgi:hypothetical protein
MLQPKVTKSVKKSVKKYNPTVKEKKNIEDAKQMKNMRPTGPSSGRIKPSQGSAKNGKPVKKALLGSLLGGAGKSMLGGMGKQMLGGMASKALGGLMGGNKESMKKGGKVSKAKSGKSFPDLNKDGKITKADILKGRGVIAKKGMTMKKCKDGCK